MHLKNAQRLLKPYSKKEKKNFHIIHGSINGILLVTSSKGDLLTLVYEQYVFHETNVERRIITSETSQ